MGSLLVSFGALVAFGVTDDDQTSWMLVRTRRNGEHHVHGNGGDNDKDEDNHQDGNVLRTVATIMRLGKFC